jgi:hypothetical protein
MEFRYPPCGVMSELPKNALPISFAAVVYSLLGMA